MIAGNVVVSFLPIALGAALAGCQLELDHAACPCAEGWVCCPSSNVCVVDGSDRCPDDRGPDDGPEIQRLQIDSPWVQDHFGGAVALSGDLAAVGIPGRDGDASSAGAVALFERRGGDAGVWVRVAVLTAPDQAAQSAFGSAVAWVGGALLVGAPGADRRMGRVYRFDRASDGWAWRETIKPDLADVTADQIASGIGLQFGEKLVADGDLAVIKSHFSRLYVYRIASTGAVRLTGFELSHTTLDDRINDVEIHGSSVVLSIWGLNRVYVLEQALGWAGTIVDEDLAHRPGALAFDGQRLAISRDSGVVSILERTGSGWAPLVEVTLPTEPQIIRLVQMAWHGDDVVITAVLAGLESKVGLARIRGSGGPWRADPVIDLGQRAADWTAMGVSGDRALIGVPYAGTDGRETGQATLYHLEETGYVEESTITFDLGSVVALAADRSHLLAQPGGGKQIVWFARDGGGEFRRRPSLVVGSRGSLVGLVAVGGSHALVEVSRSDDMTNNAVQTFELGDQDWVAGQLLTSPEAGAQYFADSRFAVDGDIAVIGARRPGAGPSQGIAFVYTWSTAGWTHAATLESAPDCGGAPVAAISGTRIALSCNRFALFQRVGDTWEAMPVPSLPESGSTQSIWLSGDRAGFVTSARSDQRLVSDVFRWVGGGWQSELHLRSDEMDCHSVCRGSIASLSGDWMVAYRDATSVVPYRFDQGAWREQPPLALPARERSPDAHVSGPMLSDDQVIVSVPSEGNGIDPRAGAIYVFPRP